MDRMTHQRQVKELKEQRSLLEGCIADVLGELDELRHVLRENEIKGAYCAPVYTLPNEILGLIFQEAYEHKIDEDCPDTCILIATHVSRRWRQVAISLPRLWRCIHITLSKSLLELYLARSGTLLLVVLCIGQDLVTNGDEPEWTIDEWENNPWISLYVQRLIHLLCYVDRIEFIFIEASAYGLFDQFLDEIEDLEMPLLNFLKLTL
ncbi:uncharacterized protein PHACADRAFT_207710 [Phanerochaete carnosa HHB-10118-sp]|uniref:F-box domain-containing protein n=1 Tax=Phanerochaete carnosa (strain HHB-10118-sp) TaxID=650164 RepID=K5VY32_PHACS|nr:uncharacterized protein PHACADRAFT_207710 [Phanerochaete carnosa HHB-10118-sp]EKM56483.1 hypothetical protein PHACADRAFT_207710 [Phanerochaete carnosa HHB-10118-sp]